MTTDIQWKLIVSTIFLTLIFSLDVVECCSKSKTTTEKPAEATDAPADPESSTMMNDDSTMMAGSTEKSLYTPYYNATYERKHIQTCISEFNVSLSQIIISVLNNKVIFFF